MKTILALISAILSVLALLGFGVLYAVAMWRSWHSKPGLEQNFVFLATSLAGLVGGFVASMFGQALPDAPNGPIAFIKSCAAHVGRLVTTQRKELASKTSGTVLIGLAYVIAYFTVGIAAIVTWLFIPNLSDLVKNLALIVMGLVVAIAGTYMNAIQNSKPPP